MAEEPRKWPCVGGCGKQLDRPGTCADCAKRVAAEQQAKLLAAAHRAAAAAKKAKKGETKTGGKAGKGDKRGDKK